MVGLRLKALLEGGDARPPRLAAAPHRRAEGRSMHAQNHGDAEHAFIPDQPNLELRSAPACRSTAIGT